MKKLPLGMQDFRQIVTGNFVYVDKTRYLHKMLEEGQNYFMSRPRRFGKTLTISTLYYLFKGEKELFKDTFIYDKWDFKEYPVVRISMTEIDTRSPETVEKTLRLKLEKLYREHSLTPRTDDYKVMFSDLIKYLSERGAVAVLIDEYDRPMLNHLGNPETAKAIRAIMREFYIVVKDTEPYLKFVLLTGITKAGIFSTLNHLDELTTQEAYSSMLGYTAEELERYFAEHLETGAAKLGCSRTELIERIRDYYDGFSFDGEHFVYNPFSILNFFKEYKLKNYWISSGLPSSLADYAKSHNLKPEDYINTYIKDGELSAYEIEQAPPRSFLAQSGYLTFKANDPYLGYLLDYPNREVRESFSALIGIEIDPEKRNLKTYSLELERS
ncbi:MAG: AAA family ATPase [Treponema sp.]|jgi:hypothetical protein|nr:AAA family ATPase [Treponema sp.]